MTASDGIPLAAPGRRYRAGLGPPFLLCVSVLVLAPFLMGLVGVAGAAARGEDVGVNLFAALLLLVPCAGLLMTGAMGLSGLRPVRLRAGVLSLPVLGRRGLSRLALPVADVTSVRMRYVVGSRGGFWLLVVDVRDRGPIRCRSVSCIRSSPTARPWRVAERLRADVAAAGGGRITAGTAPAEHPYPAPGVRRRSRR